MDITVAGLDLAVHERLELHKNRITPLPEKDGGKRISVVTGIHGDELEGQYAAWLLNRRLMEHPRIFARHRRYLSCRQSAGH